ncbi:hypothetical protein EJ04DRAFT_578805 [Polyplosphaeria fusca]|uniref:Prion-inhibition and propagation HeLo domain-containing protein n=1 Tax=Polyplosphaeria fusca TaxID=682080 RepID=A0A9P4UX73_9PLEO|nr:hypothetical protein EJ04DRAFT_578805 [Polyplosphaeria fusca]
MAEVGTILSVVSLTFQVFSGCVQGYQLITDAMHMPEECQYLRVRLKTEQYRLLDWAEVVQLDEQDDRMLISNSSKGLLLDVLDQQRRLLHQYGRLDDKYKKLSKPLLSDAQEAKNGVLPDPPAYSETDEKSPTLQRTESDFQSRFPSSEALLKKSLDFARKSQGVPRRLKWVVFDKAKFENLVLRLTSFNDFMREMLNSAQLDTLAIKQTRTEFQIMQLNSSIQNLVQIFESAALKLQHSTPHSRIPTNPVKAFMHARGFGDSEEDGAEHNQPVIHNLAFLAQMKALNFVIDDPSKITDEYTSSLALPHSASDMRSVELSPQDITILDPEPTSPTTNEHSRVEAYFQPPHGRKTSIWIEYKTYEPPTFASSSPDPKVLERVSKLALLLKENDRPERFRVPHCIGYFNDVDPDTLDPRCRFGLAFEKPGSAHPSTRPISLHTLLTSPRAEVPMPSLTSRILLMRSLAETLEKLHAVDWLHKGLRSANILFFSDSGAGDIEYSEPYLSGFDYSRPATHDEWTEKPPENAREDVYRHPRVQGSGNRGNAAYKKSFDVYALGVVLVEIAYWRCVEEVLGIEDLGSAKPSVAMKVRGRLLEGSVLGYVRGHLGERVEGVVRACLEGPGAMGVGVGVDEKSARGGEALGRGFYREVVRVLGDLRV